MDPNLDMTALQFVFVYLVVVVVIAVVSVVVVYKLFVCDTLGIIIY